MPVFTLTNSLVTSTSSNSALLALYLQYSSYVGMMPGYPDCTSWKDRRCQDTPIAPAGRLEKQWLRCKTEVDAAKVACTEEALNFTSYLTLTSPYLDLYIDNDLTSPFFLPYLYLSIPSILPFTYLTFRRGYLFLGTGL